MGRKRKGGGLSSGYVTLALSVGFLLLVLNFVNLTSPEPVNPLDPNDPIFTGQDLMTCQRIDSSSLTDSQLRDIARNFDAWYVHDTGIEGTRHAYTTILRDENPDMYLGFYLHAISDQWISDLNPQHKDYYYLKDASGNTIKGQSGESAYLDLGNPEVSLAWANAAKRRFDRWNYDFVMADLFIPDIDRFVRWTYGNAHPVNRRTGNLYTFNEWLSDMTAHYSRVKSVIGDKDYIANIGWGYVWSTNDVNLPIYKQLDGILFEDYSERSVESSELVLEALSRQRTRDQNIFFYWTNNQYSSMYRLCFYLMNAHSDSFITVRGDEGFANQYKGKLGNPIGNFYKVSDGVYAREFEKATVKVNLSTHVGVISPK